MLEEAINQSYTRIRIVYFSSTEEFTHLDVGLLERAAVQWYSPEFRWLHSVVFRVREPGQNPAPKSGVPGQ